MKKYVISQCGVGFDLYSVSCGEINEEKIKTLIKERPIIAVFPSAIFDFSVVCYDTNGEKYGNSSDVLSALFHYFLDVRGYPKCELDILLFDKPKRLALT